MVPDSFGAGEGTAQRGLEHGPIWEIGKRVVVGAVSELAGEQFAVRDVARREDDASDTWLIEQVDTDELEEAPFAVAVADASDDGLAATAAVPQRVEHRLDQRAVGRMRSFAQRGREVGIVGRGADDAGQRGTRVARRPGAVDDEDHVVGPFEQVLEARQGPHQPVMLGDVSDRDDELAVAVGIGNTRQARGDPFAVGAAQPDDLADHRQTSPQRSYGSPFLERDRDAVLVVADPLAPPPQVRKLIGGATEHLLRGGVEAVDRTALVSQDHALLE